MHEKKVKLQKSSVKEIFDLFREELQETLSDTLKVAQIQLRIMHTISVWAKNVGNYKIADISISERNLDFECGLKFNIYLNEDAEAMVIRGTSNNGQMKLTLSDDELQIYTNSEEEMPKELKLQFDALEDKPKIEELTDNFCHEENDKNDQI